GLAGGWSLADYGGEQGLTIPAKGMTIELTPENWLIYQRCIRNYENHPDAHYDADSGRVIIDGAPADTYTFKMDYYFMMGDNRDASQDSRFWGFVPEDHIVGTPMIVLASFDQERGWFDGKIRFNRILRDANPDK
ncbi:MAG: S26 family signal peptidase, partial [Muribaculaceae bacterium]|nr:S26 family signal peptidase [Muribaculaceae bacterium]